MLTKEDAQRIAELLLGYQTACENTLYKSCGIAWTDQIEADCERLRGKLLEYVQLVEQND